MLHEECPLIFRDKRLIGLDIETSGLSILYNTIIEIGIVEMVDGKVKTSATKMFGGGHSSMYLVRKVHHISDRERRGLRTFADCAERISAFLEGAILVTHNGNAFDIPMIQEKLRKAGHPLTEFRSIDTLQLVRKMRRDLNKGKEKDDEKSDEVVRRNSLGSLCAEFGLVYGGDSGNKAHRGLEDTEACMDLLFHLINTKKISISI